MGEEKEFITDLEVNNKWSLKFHTKQFVVIFIASMLIRELVPLFANHSNPNFENCLLLFCLSISFLSGFCITVWLRELPVLEVLILSIFQFIGEKTAIGILIGFSMVGISCFGGALFGAFVLKISKLNKDISLARKVIIFILFCLIMFLSSYLRPYLTSMLYMNLFFSVLPSVIFSEFIIYALIGTLFSMLFKRIPLISLLIYLFIDITFSFFYYKQDHFVFITNKILYSIMDSLVLLTSSYLTYKIKQYIQKTNKGE